jgi:hypothetical protein
LTILSETTSLENRMEDLKGALDNHIAGADQYDDITLLGFERKS